MVILVNISLLKIHIGKCPQYKTFKHASTFYYKNLVPMENLYTKGWHIPLSPTSAIYNSSIHKYFLLWTSPSIWQAVRQKSSITSPLVGILLNRVKLHTVHFSSMLMALGSSGGRWLNQVGLIYWQEDTSIV